MIVLDGLAFKERLCAAETALMAIVTAKHLQFGPEYDRLQGKVEGVQLAISYIEEEIRQSTQYHHQAITSLTSLTPYDLNPNAIIPPVL